MTAIYAHRGSAGPTVRENTLDAFGASAGFGADGVELDVRRTADGCLVVHHDIGIGGLGPISACRHRELPEWMPTLVDALDTCLQLGLAVNVEVKSEPSGPSHDPKQRCAAESAALCAATGAAVRIVMSSFSTAALAVVREVDAELSLAWLVGRVPVPLAVPWSEGILATLGLEGVHPADSLVDAAYVEAAHADGLAVRVWTVDEPGRVAELAGLGVEAIITNDVATALRAVGRPVGAPAHR